MSESRPQASQLPAKPDLRYLKNQVKDRLRNGEAPSLALALLQTARQYGFQSWSKLKAHVLAQTLTEALKQAVSRDDLAEVRRLLSQHQELRNAPVGYAGDGPLTWAAECRGMEQPSLARLDLVRWLISTGSDVHEGGDAPLMRASLSGSRTPMMQLLVDHGADVNAVWHGSYPVLFAPCEALDPTSLGWLLQHGSDPNCGTATQWQARQQLHPGTGLDYVLGTYVRDKDALNQSIQLLQDAGGLTKYDEPGVLATITGDNAALEKLLHKDSSILQRRYPLLDIGTTAGRMLTLKGATLLHVAAEFGQVEIAERLLHAGAEINAPALTDANGVGGQTAIFHAATQNGDFGVAAVRFLLEKGADLTERCRLPGHYERLDDVFEGTVFDYARLFPESGNRTVELLRRSQHH